MKFGISHSPFQWWTRIEQLEEWVLKAEQLGYEGVFTPDHYNEPRPEARLVDAWTTLSYIAAKTSKIRVGSLVSPVPRWVPSQLAKVIASVDILSNSRVIAGLGAGDYRDEFVNYAPGGFFDEPRIRFEKFLEGVQIILKLWAEERVTFKGKYYTLENAILKPKPVQRPYPPIWSGGHRARMIEATARYFNGWIPIRFKVPPSLWRARSIISISGPEEYEVYVRRIKEYLKKFGREENTFTFGILGGINYDVELVEKYREAGCQYYIVDLVDPAKPIPEPAQCIEFTKKFAEEVIPSFT